MLTELDLSLWLRCATDPILTLEDNACVWQCCVCMCVRQRAGLYLADSPQFLTVKYCDLAGLAGRAGTCPSLAENAWFVNDLELAETRWITYTMILWVCTHEFAHLDARVWACVWEIICKCLYCVLCFCVVHAVCGECWCLYMCKQKSKFIFNLQSIYIQSSMQGSHGHVLKWNWFDMVMNCSTVAYIWNTTDIPLWNVFL